MNLADVMDELAAELGTIAGLRVYAYPADSPQPPAAIVTFPESYVFDETFGRGMDRLTIPVTVVVGRSSDRASRDQLAPYVDGSGPQSIKAVLEAGSYTAMDTVHVTRAEFDIVAIAAVEYLAATLAVDIAGQGAP